MANGYEFDTEDGMNGEFGYGRPTWLPSIEEYRTPGEDWASFVSTQRPFWSTRAPMADVGRGLQARYLLGAPYMAETGATPSFAQFLKDYPSETVPSYRAEQAMPAHGEWHTWQQTPRSVRDVVELRRRALEAAGRATTAPGPYLAELDPGTEEWNRRAWLASQFGADAPGAQANQLAVANLLALQRPGGGMFRGQMADAIRGAMSRLQQQRVNQGAPKESFLDWYLTQTKGQTP
jgi:hypothetical protein